MSQQRANHFRRFAGYKANLSDRTDPASALDNNYDLTTEAVSVLITSFQNLEAIMLPLFGRAATNFQFKQLNGSTSMFRPELPLHLSITPPSKEGDTLFEIARAQPDLTDPHVSTSWAIHNYDGTEEKFDVTRTIAQRDKETELSMGHHKTQTAAFKLKETRGKVGFEDLASDFLSTSYSLLSKKNALVLATALKNLQTIIEQDQSVAAPTADSPTAPGGVA